MPKRYKVLFFGLPLTAAGIFAGSLALLPMQSLSHFVGAESGLVEITTACFGFIAAFLSLAAAAKARSHQRAWLIIFAAGAVYFAGEEISWGQHWLGWETPATIAAINDQQETNLHNTSSWLDQKPRLALELWVLACIIACFLRPNSSLGPIPGFWPSRPLWLVSALAILIRFPERLADAGWAISPIQGQLRWAELQEWFFAQFMLLYAVDQLVNQWRQARQSHDVSVDESTIPD